MGREGLGVTFVLFWKRTKLFYFLKICITLNLGWSLGVEWHGYDEADYCKIMRKCVSGFGMADIADHESVKGGFTENKKKSGNL